MIIGLVQKCRLPQWNTKLRSQPAKVVCLCLDGLWKGRQALHSVLSKEPVYSLFILVIIFLPFWHIIISTITFSTSFFVSQGFLSWKTKSWKCYSGPGRNQFLLRFTVAQSLYPYIVCFSRQRQESFGLLGEKWLSYIDQFINSPTQKSSI